MVSLDLSKAFNRTWTPIVLEELVKWGFKGHLLHFLRNFLTDRTFRVIIGNNRSSVFREETGVPQGSVIAVTLFLIAMNRIFNRLPKNIHIFVYADDVLVVTVGRTTVRIRIQAQAAVTAIAKWAASAGFQLSAAKSIRCHVCPSNHRINGPAIRIGDQPIPLRKSVRVLGVVIDRTLNFGPHFNAVKANCRSRLNLIRTISRPHRTNNRAIRMKVAKAIINSRLSYGLELTGIAKEKLIQILGPIYNGYIRIVSGLLPSTPADAACAEVGALPFRFFVNAAIATKAATYVAKSSGTDRIHLLDEANGILRAAANADLPPVAKSHWLGGKSWLLQTPNIENRIKNSFRAGDNSAALRRSVAELVQSKYGNYTCRYTDGSLSSAGVGIGIAGDIEPISRSLPLQCSVYSAEAAAIYVAATIPSERPIIILSDSHSAIAALQSDAPEHPWIQAVLESAPADTVYAWIPGHCGVPGNADADQLAGAGPSGPRQTNTVPLADLKRWIADVTHRQWQAEWMGNQTYLTRKIKDSVRPWKDLPKWKDQQVISRLRTGHTRVSHDFSGTASSFRKICPICNVPSSVEHVLCACPEYQDLRNLYSIPENIHSALGNDPSTLVALIAFLKESALYFQI